MRTFSRRATFFLSRRLKTLDRRAALYLSVVPRLTLQTQTIHERESSLMKYGKTSHHTVSAQSSLQALQDQVFRPVVLLHGEQRESFEQICNASEEKKTIQTCSFELKQIDTVNSILASVNSS